MAFPGAPAKTVDYKGKGILGLLSSDEMMEQEQEASRVQAEKDTQNDPLVIGLAAYVDRCWQAAQTAKNDIQRRLEKCLRQRRGEYEPEKLTEIEKQGGSKTYIRLTDTICRAAESWMKDILFPAGERPFSIEPTPIPDLPPQVDMMIEEKVRQEIWQTVAVQGADTLDSASIQERVERLADDINKELKDRAQQDADELVDFLDDELLEGGWYQALKQSIPDIIDYPTAFIKGPVVRMRKMLEWSDGTDGRPPGSHVQKKAQRRYYRVSPFDIYPSPGARNIDDGFLIERMRMRRRDLHELIGVKGFSESAIRAVIEQYGTGGLRDWLSGDTTRAHLEDRPHEREDPEGSIDCLEFNGSIMGSQIIEWGATYKPIGFDAEDFQPTNEYEVSTWKIGTYVIGVKMNPHPLDRRYYYAASFDLQNDSVWGRSVPEIIRDIQDNINATVRAMVNNLALASGPQVWYRADLIPPGVDISEMFPWKFWPFNGDAMAAGRGDRVPMGFFQPESNVRDLWATIKEFFEMAHTISGIPPYTYGSGDVGGAGRTASGLSMLMNAASKGLKMVIGHIDDGMIKPSVTEHHRHIMLFDPKKARGDVQIRARASDYLIMLEQLQIRLTELIGVVNNPVDMKIIGEEGRADLLRKLFQVHKVPGDIVPDDHELKERRMREVEYVIQTISQALGIPPQLLMQIVQTGMVPNTQPRLPAPEDVDVAGNKTGGRDFGLFNRGT